ncbi:MAG: NAD(+)/NADH kinase [Gracilimonas sp.]|uniref:NAD(+)/NADH kinase n=1 Tax=Gracilimonas TaxID=649462 RepID=UPI001AFD0C58|nr:NAD(+)/NADH kinase [Gracilimonas sp.]MBO6585071.1 NAD(+)/NADH kinase [Gracilimonas sp.]MBO6615658.1 NAD(+)/NADH kinase [Gracilimonas sp.]
MKLGIVANPQKYEVREVLSETIKWAERKNISLFINKEVCEETGLNNTEILQKTNSDTDSIKACDIVLVMGGDGTILYTARISKDINKPILGINSGRLGFMANTQIEDLERALDCLLNNDYTLDKRSFLLATDTNGNKYHALNEFLFTRKDSISMVNVTAEYDGSLINTYWADGLIVASPTGSTAYNLASGGPIVAPGTEVFLVTPINPHTLTTRPLVLNSAKPLRVVIEKQQSEVQFSYDGQVHEIENFPFEVEILKSDLTFDLVHLPGQDYFETLRNKLMWGMDKRRS